MRTYEHAKGTDYLGRYYTQELVSRLLVKLLPTEHPRSVLDLGAGDGSLSVAASSMWSDTALITVDVDYDASKILRRRLRDGAFRGRHHHLPSDALGLGLKSELTQREISPPGIAVCNPPFLVPKWRKGYGQLLEEAGFNGSLPAITSTDSAALFLAQNLRLLADGGSLGIIVPDSLVCAEKYLGFRASLLEKYEIFHAIRLPRGSFVGTDALAHILVITKCCPTSDVIRLSSLSSTTGPLLTIDVERDQAIRRLDYTYHAAQIMGGGVLKLSDVTIDLRRGNLNSAEVRSSSSFVLHTTDITTDMCGKWIDLSKHYYRPSLKSQTTQVAEPGDVILARVGRNAAEKVIGVASGHVALSDCLYRLRVYPEYCDLVLRCLASASGRRWMDMHAYGVAARHISKTDLLNMPLNFI